MALGQRRQMRAADLLLALDEELELQRQFAVDRLVDLGRVDAGQRVALVIHRAAGVELAVAHRCLVGRRLPLLQRVGRLHIIVRVAEQTPRARPTSPKMAGGASKPVDRTSTRALQAASRFVTQSAAPAKPSALLLSLGKLRNSQNSARKRSR